MSDLTKAIHKLKPSSECSFVDNDYSTIKWDVLEGNAPTQQEIDQALSEIEADELAEVAAKANAKAALLKRLGITADEAALLLG